MLFDAVILADSPHAQTKLLGITLVERGRRTAQKSGARRVYVVDSAAAAAGLAAWDADRGDAALVAIRAGDQVVHRPLVDALLAPAQPGAPDRRLAVGPGGDFAGALWATGAAAREAIAAIAAAPSSADATLAAAWPEAERVVHGEIARHAATTPAERKAAANMLLQLLIKKTEDSPVSKYIYRPLSRPLTRLLLHTPITANQVSYVVAVIGLVGCWFTALPGQTNLIIGAALVFISGVIDGCDGEISRMRLTSSPFGAWLDTIVDECTTFSYFVAIGYHTYTHHPEPWIAYTIVLGAACYLSTVYAIYYFCIVVLKAGGSQYYIGKLDIVDGSDGVGLRPKLRAPSMAAPWLRKLGEVATWIIRRDFVNVAALFVTFADGYAFIYFSMLVGGVVTAIIVVPEHLKLRAQLRELARRGAAPRLLSA